MQYDVLRAELLTDPLTLGYSGMTDAQAAAKLDDATLRALTRTVVNGYEIVGCIVSGDLSAATQIQLSRLTLVCSASGGVNIQNANTRQILTDLFSGASAATKNALLALQTTTQSRATELGLGTVLALDVTRARAGVW